MIRLASVLITFCIGCAPQAEPSDSISPSTNGTGDDGPVIGVVQVVGSAPVNVQVVLQPEEGRSIRLTGPLASELERLAGVRVSVEGQIQPSSDPIVDRQIEATDYQILTVNGQPVVQGEIVSVSGGTARLRTPDGEEVYLTGAPTEFQVGQKVWVQGPRGVIVQSYGVVRP